MASACGRCSNANTLMHTMHSEQGAMEVRKVPFPLNSARRRSSAAAETGITNSLEARNQQH